MLFRSAPLITGLADGAVWRPRPATPLVTCASTRTPVGLADTRPGDAPRHAPLGVGALPTVARPIGQRNGMTLHMEADQGGDFARQLIDKIIAFGIDGAGPFKGAREVADEHRRQYADVDVAIDRLIR